MERLFRYFPELTERQKEQFAALPALYEDWNSKINVVSRKDMDNFVVHHLLHSLAIAKVQPFKSMCDILDVGTGGGFPGVPLAIMFPETRFVLVDSIGKKIKVVQAVIDSIGLSNATAHQMRAEQVQGDFDFIVSRAVTGMSQFVPWVRGKVSKDNYHALRNGLLLLKGGDLDEELRPFARKAKVYEISNYFDDPFFETKKVVYLPMAK